MEIMFTVVTYVLGGVKGNTPIRVEFLNFPTPTDLSGGGDFPSIGILFAVGEITSGVQKSN